MEFPTCPKDMGSESDLKSKNGTFLTHLSLENKIRILFSMTQGSNNLYHQRHPKGILGEVDRQTDKTANDLPFLEAKPVSFTLFTYSLRTPSSSTEESENPRKHRSQNGRAHTFWMFTQQQEVPAVNDVCWIFLVTVWSNCFSLFVLFCKAENVFLENSKKKSLLAKMSLTRYVYPYTTYLST